MCKIVEQSGKLSLASRWVSALPVSVNQSPRSPWCVLAAATLRAPGTANSRVTTAWREQSDIVDTLRYKSSSRYSETSLKWSATLSSGGGSDACSATPDRKQRYPAFATTVTLLLVTHEKKSRYNSGCKGAERSTENTTDTELNGDTLIATVQFEPSRSYVPILSVPQQTDPTPARNP